MSQPLIVPADQAPAALKVVGEEITVLAPASSTGSYEIFRQGGPEGSGPPPHAHGWDEAFFVLGGEVMFGVDGHDDVSAGAGTFVHVPGGTTHWFRFGAGGGDMVSVTSRGGASDFFAQLDREVSPVDPDLGDLIRIAGEHGLTIPAPPS